MEPTSTLSPQTFPKAEESTILVIREHIVRTPETCGGKPRIAGSRIPVKHVVIWHERMGQSPAQIVSDYPHLTLADVYAALAYYHDHREEINADIQAERQSYEGMKESLPSRLGEKIQQRKADVTDNPLSS
jgi:uncharacterized protein (DUF433 family)